MKFHAETELKRSGMRSERGYAREASIEGSVSYQAGQAARTPGSHYSITLRLRFVSVRSLRVVPGRLHDRLQCAIYQLANLLSCLLLSTRLLHYSFYHHHLSRLDKCSCLPAVRWSGLETVEIDSAWACGVPFYRVSTGRLLLIHQ